MQFEQKPMVGWYDVKQLMSTAVKTVVSSVFGSYSDKREIQAFSQQQTYFDFSEKDELWIDYISDLGDGFNSTYTIAHFMAMNVINIQDKSLQRGDLLIMGGDEVYPTPEKIEYKNRLQGPYNAAFPWKNDELKAQKPKLFAIPGNHDWYDGLTNFIRLFCQGRALGNWLTMQKRSYFAIKLPHHHWLLGIDIQLKGDIDDPQIAYFKEMATNSFQTGDKIILCTAEPAWVYASLSGDFDAEERLNFFIDRVLKGSGDDPKLEKIDVHVEAILTGDLHHYSRYEMQTKIGRTTQLITAGGGGAFMHPTHLLKEKIDFRDGSKANLEGVFPTSNQSRTLSWRNLAFPYYNWSMCLFLGAFHVLTSWFIQSTTNNQYGNSFMDTLAGMDFNLAYIDNFLHIIFESLQHSPSAVLLNLILFAGILLFTDTSTGMKNWNYIAGFIHGVAQLANLYMWIWLISIWNICLFHLHIGAISQAFLFTFEMVLLGGISSGFIFGIYLLVSTLMLKSHPTEASSSFRHEGFKNFLRMHVTKDKLTIYPIGLKDIVHNWKNTGSQENPLFEGSPVTYDLIENKPIEIPYLP